MQLVVVFGRLLMRQSEVARFQTERQRKEFNFSHTRNLLLNMPDEIAPLTPIDN